MERIASRVARRVVTSAEEWSAQRWLESFESLADYRRGTDSGWWPSQMVSLMSEYLDTVEQDGHDRNDEGLLREFAALLKGSEYVGYLDPANDDRSTAHPEFPAERASVAERLDMLTG